MGAPIRIAREGELPPGQGVVVQLGAREIAIYNLEGRFHAASMGGRAHGEPSRACVHGRRFDALAEDSPARLAETRFRATVENGYVVVYVD